MLTRRTSMQKKAIRGRKSKSAARKATKKKRKAVAKTAADTKKLPAVAKAEVVAPEVLPDATGK